MQANTPEEASATLIKKLADLRSGGRTDKLAEAKSERQAVLVESQRVADSVSHVVTVVCGENEKGKGMTVNTSVSLVGIPLTSELSVTAAAIQKSEKEVAVIDLRFDSSAPVVESKPKTPFLGAMTEFINEMEKFVETTSVMIGGKRVEKPANLIEKYKVSPEVTIAAFDEFSEAKPEDFVRQKAVEALDDGNVLNVGIEGFDAFRILKVCSTESSRKLREPKTGRIVKFEKSICVVEIQVRGGAIGKRELLVTFPLTEGENILFQDPVTQKVLGKRPILSIDINKRPPSSRFLAFVSKMFKG